MKKNLAIIAIVLLWAALPCAAAVRNLTDENRVALGAKVLELRQTELMRISRGRVKPNPIKLPHFTMYQTVILDQDLLISRQLEEYKAALRETQRVRQDFAAFVAMPLGGEISRIFDERLIEAYSIRDTLGDAINIWEVWHILAISNHRMQALPVEFRMALNAGRWLTKIQGEAPTEKLVKDLLEICRTEINPISVFETDRQLNALSKKYSDYFLKIAKPGENP